MSNYIDGFVHPIPRSKLDDYKRLVPAVAEIWKEHGALAYWESVGDDLHLEGTRSFVDVIDAAADEVVLFGWVVFESLEKRNQANASVAVDPRVGELMASFDTGFDAGRMAYGGFQVFVSTGKEA